MRSEDVFREVSEVSGWGKYSTGGGMRSAGGDWSGESDMIGGLKLGKVRLRAVSDPKSTCRD